MRFKRLIFRITKGTTWTIVANVKYDLDVEGKIIEPVIDTDTVLPFSSLLKFI